MLNYLRRLFLPEGRFRIARVRVGLPRCNIRAVQDEDFDRCEEIYRANERAHFPDGYFPNFSTWLRERRALVLVAESDGIVNAVCGVSAQEEEGRHFCGLSFSMVHPTLHGRGYGTALLLARLSLASTPKPESFAMLTTTGGSERFYKRFGFKFLHSLQPTPTYREDHYFVIFNQADRARCKALLNGQVNVDPELHGRQLPDFARLTTHVPTVLIDG